jgi:hypothetical protein
MSTVRLRMRRWGLLTRAAGVRVEPRQALVVLACVVVVFAVFFELGRMTRAGGAVSQAYGPQRLPTLSVSAGIPYGLPAESPIPSLVVAEAPAPAAPAVAAGSTPGVAGSSSAPSETTAASPSAAAPLKSVSPAPAPVQAAPAPVSRPRSPAPASEGGSFDSSG